MKHVRFVPLALCVVLAAVLSMDLLGEALMKLLQAGASMILWAGWVGGPLAFAVCLAFLVREKPVRIVFDLALVILTVVDVLAAGCSLLWFVPGREVMFYLPMAQYFGLTALLVVLMLIPELAKKRRSGTYEGI